MSVCCRRESFVSILWIIWFIVQLKTRSYMQIVCFAHCKSNQLRYLFVIQTECKRKKPLNILFNEYTWPNQLKWHHCAQIFLWIDCKETNKKRNKKSVKSSKKKHMEKEMHRQSHHNGNGSMELYRKCVDE